jgi:hypothetical protein
MRAALNHEGTNRSKRTNDLVARILFVIFDLFVPFVFQSTPNASSTLPGRPIRLT